MLEQKSSESTTLPVVEQGTLFDAAELARLTLQREQWEHTTVKKSLERLPERDHLMTTSGVPIHRVYTPLDTASSLVVPLKPGRLYNQSLVSMAYHSCSEISGILWCSVIARPAPALTRSG